MPSPRPFVVGLAAVAALAWPRAASADPPTAPTPSAPMCGAEIASHQAALTVTNAVDPQGSPLLYAFQLYRDAALTVLVAESTDLVPQGAGPTTTWPVPGGLLENTRYYWRARARNQTDVGPYSAPACAFFVNSVNEPPGPPRINSPPFGGQVNTYTPTLRVDNALDPDLDVLRYQFELFADPALSTRVAATPAVGVAEGGGGVTSWQVVGANPVLTEDRFYYWRARACDPDGLCGPFTATGSFFVTVTNATPEPPSIVSPQNGTVAGELRPALTIANADDADLDPLVYDWDLATDITFANPIWSGANDPPTGAQTTTFSLGEDLREDHRYCWRVRADDGQAQSAYSVACFLVSVANDPPSVPVLVRPSDEPRPTDTVPIFSWEPSIDPEDDPITYELEVKDAAGEVVDTVTGVTGTIAVLGPELTPSSTYTWRARAIDRLGAASAWSPEAAFTVEGPADTGCCRSEGGCQASQDPGRATGAGLGLALVVVVVVARRRRRRG